MDCSTSNNANHNKNSTTNLLLHGAYETLIQVDTSRFTPIERITVGDSILAAGKDLKWEKRVVKLANCNPEIHDNSMSVLISFANTQLAVALDHFLLLSNGKLARACDLLINDTLSDASGNPIAITSLELGKHSHRRCNIATSLKLEDDNLSGHLLIMNGVVCADYTLQLFYKER